MQASTPSSSSQTSSVKFVYPRKQGKTPYEFGKKHRKQQNSSSSSIASPLGEKQVSESIDDILSLRKSKKTKKRQLTTGEDDSWMFADSTKSIASQNENNHQVDGTPEVPQKSKKRKGSIDETDAVETKKSTQSSAQSTSTSAPQPSHLTGVSVEEAVRDKAGLRPRANSTDGELELPRRGLCDETMVLQSYKWSDSVKNQKIPKGLHNLGNTCFLNSTIQCLAYLPPFVQSILSIPPSTKNNNHQHHARKTPKGKLVTHTVQALFRRLHNTGSNKKVQLPGGGSGAVTPRDMANALDYLSSYKRGGYKFRRGRQEDAHEFLVHLLDCMNDGELREAGINQEKSGWRDRLPVPRLDQTTFVVSLVLSWMLALRRQSLILTDTSTVQCSFFQHRVFGGYFRSQVKCGICEYKSNTYDPFLDLSLEVNKSCRSLDDALREFSRKEVLDSDNRWRCSGCKKRVRATKQLTVFRPPLSLCIQLKRFSFSEFGGFGYGGSGQKITKRVSYPADLRLPLSDGRSCEYQLTGAVLHLGQSPTSGHYTAFVRKPTNGKRDQWFCMDDSYAEPQHEQHVLQSRDAYLLFYSRKTVKLDLPQAIPPLPAPEATKDDDHETKGTQGLARDKKAAKVKAPPPEAFKLDSKASMQAPKLKAPLATAAASVIEEKKAESITKTTPAKVKPDNDNRATSKQNKREAESASSKSKDSNHTAAKSELSQTKTTEKPGTNDTQESSMRQAKGPLQRKQMPVRDKKRASAKPPVARRTVDLDSPSSDSESSTDSSSDSEDEEDNKKDKSDTPAKVAPKDDSSDSDETSSSDESDDESKNDSEELQTPSQPKYKQPKNKRASGEKVFEVMFGAGSESGGRTGVGVSKKDNDTGSQVINHRAKNKSPGKAGKRKPFTGKSRTSFSRSSVGAKLELLGNTPTSKWDSPDMPSSATSDATRNRNVLERSMKKKESSAKRRLHNDRWDNSLDAGRTPKKKKKSPKFQSYSGMKNRFQMITNNLKEKNLKGRR